MNYFAEEDSIQLDDDHCCLNMGRKFDEMFSKHCPRLHSNKCSNASIFIQSIQIPMHCFAHAGEVGT